MARSRQPCGDELLPLICCHSPGKPAAAILVAETINQYGQQGMPIRAVMPERQCANVWQQTPAAAMATLEELEETARLCLLVNPAPKPLTEVQIDELRQTFGARW